MILWLLAAAGVARAGVQPADSGRYLSAPRVARELLDRSALLGPCGQGVEDGAGPLRLRVEPTGTIRVDAAPSLNGGQGLADCLEAALAERPLPAHDEAPLLVSATLVVRGGVASLGPVVDLHERVLPTLFLFFPPGEADALRLERWRLLGLSAAAGASAASGPEESAARTPAEPPQSLPEPDATEADRPDASRPDETDPARDL